MTNADLPQQAAKLTIEQALQQAIEHHKAGRLQDAERLYRSILQAQATHPDANHNLGVLALQGNQPLAGLPHFRAALAANLNNSQYWLSYINALIQAERLDAARIILDLVQARGLRGEVVNGLEKQLTNVRPSPDEAIQMANKFYQEGQDFVATSICQQVLQINPDHAVALNLQGSIALKNADLIGAEALLRQAISIRPDYVGAIINLGNMFLEKKLTSEAVACYEKAIVFDPDCYTPYNNLGGIQYICGNVELAISYYQKALQLSPLNAAIIHNLGVAIYMQGNVTGAINCFSKSLALGLDSWVIDSAAYLAVLHNLEGDISKTGELINAFMGVAVNKNGKLATYFSYLASLMQSKGNVSRINMQQDEELLYVVGESHALSYHNVQVSYNGKSKTCQSKWIAGCKQWHLGNDKANQFKYKFEGVMARLPRQSTILMTIGEIDCRPDEGIISVLKKYPGKTVEEVVHATASAYIVYVDRIAVQYGHRVIVSGVPATNIQLDALTAETAEQLVNIIRVFNAVLKQEVLAAGMEFLDVYALTDWGNGIASGQWHIDSHHLQPAAIVEAFARYCQATC
jgi:Flp pilus assembly protein TadD